MALTGVAHMVARDDDDTTSTPQITTGDPQVDTLLKLLSGGFQSQISSTSLLASLAFSLVSSALIVLLFCFLRPYNNVVYAPRAKYADAKHLPPPMAKHPLAWIGPVWKTKESELVEKLGLDAAVFLRFNRMCRNMFIVLSIIGCAVLIPVNVTASRKPIGNADGIWFLTRLTPQYLVNSSALWAYVVVSYVFSAVVCGFLWWNYRAIVRLRRDYFNSPEYQNSLAARTLLVTQIPNALRSNEGLQQIAEETYNTHAVPRAAIGRNVKDLPQLVADHTQAVEHLEEVLAKYLKNPNKLPPNRPTCKVDKNDEYHKKGEKVDAIEYLTNRITQLEQQIKDVRRTVDNRNATNYGFASYTEISDAHLVAYAGRKRAANNTRMRLTPKPTDLIWKNLPMTDKERRWARFINNIWVALLTLFYVAPNVMSAVFLANLSHLGQLWPAFNRSLMAHPSWWGVVQGILAPAIQTLFFLWLPFIFRRLSIKSGDLSKTSRDRHVLHKLFAFFVFNNLVIYSIFSALWAFAVVIISAAKDHQNAFDAIKRGNVFKLIVLSLESMSVYWLTWLLQRNLGAAIDLAQLVNLAWGSFSRRWLSPTPRQLIRLSAPQPFDYPSYYNYFLFYVIVALCYAPFQPLALPVTAIYFLFDSQMKKYLLMYVFITKTESGGRYWRVVYNRTLFSAIAGALTMALIVGAQGSSWFMLIAIAPLPFLLIGFKFYCARVFDDKINFFTTTQNIEKDGESPVTKEKVRATEKVGVRFGHPVLYKPLITPMVHARAQGLLKQVYSGRMDHDDDTHTVSGYSDVYMNQMSSSRPGKAAAAQNAPFEIVNEHELDFSHFKDRQDFRGDAGGDGELYGRNPDMIRRNSEQSTISDLMYGGARADSRAGSIDSSVTGVGPRPGSAMGGRTDSVSSERTKVDNSGVSYPAGYRGIQHTRTGSALRDQSLGASSQASDDLGNRRPYPGRNNSTFSDSAARLLSDAERMGRTTTNTTTNQPPHHAQYERSTSRSASRGPGGQGQSRYRDESLGPAGAMTGRWGGGEYTPTPGGDEPPTSYDYFRGRR